MNTFLRDQLKDFANSIGKIMPRRTALASGIFLLISILASSKSQAALVFAGGTVTPATQYVCSGSVGTLSFTATSIVGGGSDWTASYQWQSSPDNVSWTNIAGANGSFSAASPTVTYVTPVLTFAGPGCAAPQYFRIVVTAISNSVVGASFTSSSSPSAPNVTVCANPAAITGPTSVCQGATITVADATAGGAWSSSTTSVATISAGGVITGVSGGTTIVTYALSPSGCSDTALITVSPRPAIITGDSTVCIGSTVTVFDTTTGGTWSMVSGTPHLSITAIGVVSGLEAATVTGITQGTNLITYTTPAGCTRTRQMTVNALPVISGLLTVCQGTTTTLTGAPTGGTWLSGNTLVASVGTSGVVTGLSGGTSIITYTDLSGCSSTVIVTVNPAPLPIAGTFTVCVSSTTSLSSGTPGGVWSSSSSFASVVGSTGVVSGVSAGTAVITYMLTSTSCFATQVVTVLAIPVPITGTMQLCEGGNTTTLGNATPGGTWASSTGAVATIGSSNGVVVTGTAGTTLISYTLPSGCYVTSVFTTSPLPTSITGSLTTCAGSTTTLIGTPSGGVWTTSSGLASVNPGTGVVTAGGTTGTASITYTLSTGCSLSAVVTITAAPPAITGTLITCVGSCTTLSHVTPGGTWASGNPAVGTVDVNGVVCGLSGGTVNITYTLPGGCLAVSVVTVSAPPPAIVGPNTVCVGATITLTNTTPGGAWSSSVPANGTVGAANGVVGGVAGGVTVITYSLTTVSNCYVTHTVTVNTAPTPIVATPTLNICVGATTTLNSTPAGGTWSTLTPGIASVNLTTGVVTGISTAGGGVGIITYTDPGGCKVTTAVTVSANPTILGGLSVCPGTTTTLAGIPGSGTWSSSSGTGTVIAFGSGIVTGVAAGPGGTPGTATVTYTAPGGCLSTVIVTVNPLPNPIVATSTNICVTGTSTLSNTTPGGTWVSGGSAATVDPLTGVVTGVSGGTVNITYQLGTGCYSWITLTVDPLLPAITGTAHVCIGSSTTLANATPGGTWSSLNTAIADVGSATGIVTGMGVGTTIISYSTASGCVATVVFTVDPLPTITPGSATICIGATTTLTGSPTGGVWSTTGGNVSVGSSSGVVTGVAAGTALVTYTIPSTGCTATATITVNALPLPDAPHGTICQFDSITLTNPTPGGGTWSSTSINVTVNGTTGVVTGVLPGTAVITFTSTLTGCTINDTVTINVGPNPINGLHAICFGDSTQLFSSPSGGFWTSSPPFCVSINPVTGMAHAVGAGPCVSTISYTLPSGCASTFSMTVNPLPTAISVAPVCVGSTTIATSSPVGGTWSATPPTIAFIDPVTGALTGLAPGIVSLTYTLPTGCSITAIDTVYALPTPIIGDTQICAGFTGTLTSTPAGGTWTSANTFILTVGSTTGIINAIGGGTVTVTYVDPHGCAASKVVTVNPIPPNIIGDSMVCVGGTITLTDITTGGTWISSNTFVATIGSASGVVTGMFPGTTIITYTLPTGCYITKVITVNPNPAPITGTLVMCSGSCVTLTVPTAGGGWSSGNPGVAVPTGIGIGVAVVCGTNTGVVPDTATIYYTLGTGCNVSVVVTVYPNPGPIGGTLQICQGDTTTLTNIIPGGTWSLTAGTGTATIVPSTGFVTGGAAGTVTVTYTVWPTNCFVTAILTINPIPNPITGDSTVCIGSTITLANSTPGGSFSSTSGNITITPSGVVTGMNAGTAVVTYTNNTTGCYITKVITVNPLPAGIFGFASTCMNDSAILWSPDSGGTWSATPPGFVTLTTLGTGGDSIMVHGIVPGPVTITYTLPTGCFITGGFTVNALPSPILGVGVICVNDSTTLFDSSVAGAGTWSFTNVTGIISVLSITGGTADSLRVYGVSAGTAIVTYTEPGHDCYITRVITVNPLPTPIFGVDTVCAGFSSTLHDTTAGGYWTSGNASVATVDTNGVVTGVTAGTAVISYILSATGCYVTHVYTVYPIPDVTVNHPGVICRKSSTTLTATGAGVGGTYVWTPTTGLSPSTGSTVTASPTITTTYTVTGTALAGGCSDTAVVTVFVDTLLNHIGITGTDTICTGMCDTLVAVGFHGSLFSWVPPAGLSCTVCDTTIACPWR
jgi:uncharacterized protein YjdB